MSAVTVCRKKAHKYNVCRPNTGAHVEKPMMSCPFTRGDEIYLLLFETTQIWKM